MLNIRFLNRNNVKNSIPSINIRNIRAKIPFVFKVFITTFVSIPVIENTIKAITATAIFKTNGVINSNK